MQYIHVHAHPHTNTHIAFALTGCVSGLLCSTYLYWLRNHGTCQTYQLAGTYTKNKKPSSQQFYWYSIARLMTVYSSSPAIFKAYRKLLWSGQQVSHTDKGPPISLLFFECWDPPDLIVSLSAYSTHSTHHHDNTDKHDTFTAAQHLESQATSAENKVCCNGYLHWHSFFQPLKDFSFGTFPEMFFFILVHSRGIDWERISVK